MNTYALWLRAPRDSRMALSYSLARAFNSEALKLKPDDVDLTYVGMVLLQRIGRRSEVAAMSKRLENECRKKLEELGSKGSKQSRLKYLLYLVELIHASRPEEAQSLLQSAIELNPNHPKALQLQKRLRRMESSLPYSDFVLPD
jgi:tetratricopeptide (TPR) repeat protein